MSCRRAWALLWLAAVSAGGGTWPARPATAADLVLEGYQHEAWRKDDGLPDNTIAAITQDPRGYLWLGTQQGLVRFDGLRFTVLDKSNSPQLHSDFITTLQLAPDGTLWIGTRNGLNYLRDGQIYSPPPGSDLAGTALDDMVLDSRGVLWLGGRGGLSRWQNGVVTTYGAAQGMPQTDVYAVAEDARGDIWAGTLEGLERIAEGSVERFSTEQGLSSPAVLVLQPGRSGALWIGTLGGGLNRLQDHNLGPYQPAQELADSLILSMCEDRNGGLWVGTRRGLYLLQGNTVRVFQARQGLVGEGVLSLLEDRDGDIWVGTWRGGLNRLRRAATIATPNMQAAREGPRPSLPVFIEKVLVNDQPLPADLRLQPAPHTNLEFHFAVVALRDPHGIRISYKLDGFDSDWRPAGDRRSEMYTNVRPGTYRFQVTAEDPFGGGAGEAAITLTVPAPFYQTWPFYAVCLLVLALGVGLLFHMRMQRLVYRSRELETRVAERTAEVVHQKDRLAEAHRQLESTYRQLQHANRELQTLHRERTDFLAIATHDLRGPLVNVKGFAGELRMAMEAGRRSLEPALEFLPPERAKLLQSTFGEDVPEALNFIDTAAERMTQLIGPILKLSRLGRRELCFLEVDMEEVVHDVLAGLAAQTELSDAEVATEALPRVIADPASMHEVMYELLRNALTYLASDRPGRVRIFGQRGPRDTVFHIEDNGIGIAESDDGKIFRLFGRAGQLCAPGQGMGLAYVRTLVQRHGGHVWYQSQFGHGTTFSFSLPNQPQPAEQPD